MNFRRFSVLVPLMAATCVAQSSTPANSSAALHFTPYSVPNGFYDPVIALGDRLQKPGNMYGPPSVAVPPVTVNGTTFAGGQIFPTIANLFADSTVVYGSGGPAPGSDWCAGCQETMTITFAQPVNNLSLELINGAAYNDTFMVGDDRGGQLSVPAPDGFSARGGR
jgi:hypothetical protein